MLQTAMQRFNEKWEKDEKTGCWNWTASLCGGNPQRDPKKHRIYKYGQFKVRDLKERLAHRVSYILHKGPINNGMWVLHKCDNPKCVNPDHLYLGTPKDNHDDMLDRDRHLRGERNTESKLAEKQVVLIHELAIHTRASQKTIAKCFDVCQMQICRILSGKRWRHVYESFKRDGK